MQPTAQAVGCKWETSKPRKGERRVLAHTLQPLSPLFAAKRSFPRSLFSDATKVKERLNGSSRWLRGTAAKAGVRGGECGAPEGVL
jgi:hypothetical protein